jgi:tetratricopeptide (TPR) repeat protein
MKYRSSAYGQMAEIYLMEANYERAEEYAKRAISYDPNSIKTREVLTTIYRRTGRAAQARAVLAEILKIDPLCHLARFETYLLQPGPATLKSFQSMIRNELPHETYLEIAAYYRNLGLDEDAAKVLAVAPDQAEIRYWQAYVLRTSAPAQSKQALAKAIALSPYLVFPFRQEAIPVFEWADQTQPANWKAKYYLGLIDWGLRREPDALKAMQAAGDEPDYAAFYASRAYLEQQSEPERAQADLERARALDPKDWRNARRLAAFYASRGQHDKALEVAESASKQFPKEDAIKVTLARAYLNAGKYQACHAALANAAILPAEGQSDVYQLYADCQMAMALEAMKQGQFDRAEQHIVASKEYPERLGTGKPADPDYRVQDLLLSLCYTKSGQSAKIETAKEAINSFAARNKKPGWDALRPKADAWFNADLPQLDPVSALRKLSGEVIGHRRHAE